MIKAQRFISFFLSLFSGLLFDVTGSYDLSYILIGICISQNKLQLHFVQFYIGKALESINWRTCTQISLFQIEMLRC